jgi:uncharacterized membrane protein YoaK (UPF0700 family)
VRLTLPRLLLVLTAAAGLVDAVSYLRLGHVFVANMTGNVVFLGFAIGGASGLSLPASLVAIASFLAGAMGGGRLGAGFGEDRGDDALAAAMAVQLVLVAAAAIVAAVAGVHGNASRYTLIVLLAIAMGTQTAIARRLGVRDLPTTVLTQTLAGLASELRIGNVRSDPVVRRRLLAVAAMLLGALVGALLVLKVASWTALAAAALLVAGVAAAARTLALEPSE